MKIKRKKGTKVTDFHAVASYYGDMLSNIRYEILGAITALVERLGGEINVRYYHNEEPETERYTYFMVDNDGHGVELFIDEVKADGNGNVSLYLSDSEDACYEVWELSDLTATDAYHALCELEEIAEWSQDSKEDIVTEYDY